MRVLGVDTSLRSSGFAVVEERGSVLSVIESGVIAIPAGRPISECLLRIHTGLSECIGRAKPDAASIEGVFFSKNVGTAVALGQARGVVIAICALAGVPVYEYAPRRVKQAVVGYGAAQKEQVRRMLMSLVKLDREPKSDEGDAMALAICHLHCRSIHEALAPEPT